MISIREYRPSDLPGLIALVRELQASEHAIYERMKAPDEMGAWYVSTLERQCLEKGGVILIADTPSGLAGYATLFTAMEEDGSGDEVAYLYAYVGDLVVARPERRRGVARLLIAACEERAKRAGRDELRLSVLAANAGARDFYRSQGFSDLLVLVRKRLS
jgi:GNAT superfamily N-acetyltransferase